MISHEVCKTYFLAGDVIPQHMCVLGWDNTSQLPCNGVSGGALVINESGTWTQIAVFSWTFPVLCRDFPNGFERLSMHIDWISQVAQYIFRQ